jgi:peptide-methionine (R)-S-oxide reductase
VHEYPIRGRHFRFVKLLAVRCEPKAVALPGLRSDDGPPLQAATLAWRHLKGARGEREILRGMDKVTRTDAEWREQLTPEEYAVLRKAGTEAPFTGEYTDTKTEGVYRCRACGAELFRSDTKFESHCGWPSFYQPTESDAVVLIEDRSLGTTRTEVRCAACDSHLGHVFAGEGYDVPTDQRWCINSVSLTLEPVRS